MTYVKHQVFVSSTFVDLRDERREVMQALLELDCIPAGMELFPASDDASWELIKSVIDLCDYYVVIVGNRYGSTTDDGLSFTEKEYDYAVSRGIPALGFVPSDPGAIPSGKSDKSESAQKALEGFRTKVLHRNCKKYTGAEDLGGKVSRAIVNARKTHPRPGWVRSGESADPGVVGKLREEIDTLRAQLMDARERPPAGAEDLKQGSDPFRIRYTFQASNEWGSYGPQYVRSLHLSWDQIFAVIGPRLVREASEEQLATACNAYIRKMEAQSSLAIAVKNDVAVQQVSSFSVDSESFDTILQQFKALGLARLSDAKHAPSDRAVYWSLTPYGDSYLTRMRALRRDQVRTLAETIAASTDGVGDAPVESSRRAPRQGKRPT